MSILAGEFIGHEDGGFGVGPDGSFVAAQSDGDPAGCADCGCTCCPTCMDVHYILSYELDSHEVQMQLGPQTTFGPIDPNFIDTVGIGECGRRGFNVCETPYPISAQLFYGRIGTAGVTFPATSTSTISSSTTTSTQTSTSLSYQEATCHPLVGDFCNFGIVLTAWVWNGFEVEMAGETFYGFFAPALAYAVYVLDYTGPSTSTSSSSSAGECGLSATGTYKLFCSGVQLPIAPYPFEFISTNGATIPADQIYSAIFGSSSTSTSSTTSTSSSVSLSTSTSSSVYASGSSTSTSSSTSSSTSTSTSTSTTRSTSSSTAWMKYNTPDGDQLQGGNAVVGLGEYAIFSGGAADFLALHDFIGFFPSTISLDLGGAIGTSTSTSTSTSSNTLTSATTSTTSRSTITASSISTSSTSSWSGCIGCNACPTGLRLEVDTDYVPDLEPYVAYASQLDGDSPYISDAYTGDFHDSVIYPYFGDGTFADGCLWINCGTDASDKNADGFVWRACDQWYCVVITGGVAFVFTAPVTSETECPSSASWTLWGFNSLNPDTVAVGSSTSSSTATSTSTFSAYSSTTSTSTSTSTRTSTSSTTSATTSATSTSTSTQSITSLSRSRSTSYSYSTKTATSTSASTSRTYAEYSNVTATLTVADTECCAGTCPTSTTTRTTSTTSSSPSSSTSSGGTINGPCTPTGCPGDTTDDFSVTNFTLDLGPITTQCVSCGGVCPPSIPMSFFAPGPGSIYTGSAGGVMATVIWSGTSQCYNAIIQDSCGNTLAHAYKATGTNPLGNYTLICGTCSCPDCLICDPPCT